MGVPILCYVTDRRALAPKQTTEVQIAALVERVRHAIAAGVNWIQLREKDLTARLLVRLAAEAVRAAQNTSTRILVNDRLDVALAAGAAGVHLGEESLPVAAVAGQRRHLPEGFLVGASCHALAEVEAAARDGADYVVFGPVFATPSKAAFGPPQGVEKLAEVCARVRVPVLAIGGITAENAVECLRAGAAGIAAIRLFQETENLAELLRRLRGAPRAG
ncbi:MAG: thiamine phosphate synthase [Firmicutes bacterium]|nr:thiamine phosphate synthase [Bacillota bacterium]